MPETATSATPNGVARGDPLEGDGPGPGPARTDYPDAPITLMRRPRVTPMRRPRVSLKDRVGAPRVQLLHVIHVSSRIPGSMRLDGLTRRNS